MATLIKANLAACVVSALLSAGIASAASLPDPGTRSATLVAPTDAEWSSVGRTADEQRFSPLTQINTHTVSNLGLAWFADFDSNRGQEATPLFVDGLLYLSTAWSKVKAYDALTGRLVWSFDPKVPGEFAGRGCCDVVNRGLAYLNGKVYVAAYDGRLIALDAKTGAVAWSTLTLDHDKPVTSTGAPRVVKGNIVIGNAGGEFGVRGYVSAYDAQTGKLAWRFYTVPGNPDQGFESPIMKKAALTWHGDWWTAGGGGTVWDGMAYDARLNLVYFGTGNGSPWSRGYRGTGGGDNLFVASIIAVNADTGAYVWHYQETPGEEWDFDATSPLMLADLTIGKPRRVLMQGAKNGFFYVLDAKTGKLISAKNYVAVNWASGVDVHTGKPTLNPDTRYDETHQVAITQPGAQGAHSWHPSSFSPQTGLVYFSAIETSGAMKQAAAFKYVPMGANTGLQSPLPSTVYEDLKSTIPRDARSQLIAWNPIEQREAWRTPVLGKIGSGTLATAGGLVFQGTANPEGKLVAYDATDGKELWSMPAQTGVVAAASSFELDGEQYIAQEVGYGLAPYGASNQSRLLVLKLGGTAVLPAAPPKPPAPVLNPPPSTASAEIIETGHQQFASHCATCHDTQYANRGAFPDLRYSLAINSEDTFEAIVLGGALQAAGMASFQGKLTVDQVQAVRAYVIARASEAKNAAASNAPPAPRR